MVDGEATLAENLVHTPIAITGFVLLKNLYDLILDVSVFIILLS